jgi:ribosome-associated protein
MVENNFDKIYDLAVKTAKMLNDHKGIDTVLIDVTQVSTWTSFFIITTVMSTGHLRGLVKELRNFLADQSVEIFHKHKQIDDNGWELMDCGDFIIHLMSQEKRDFYDLDKLWHQGDMITLEAR